MAVSAGRYILVEQQLRAESALHESFVPKTGPFRCDFLTPVRRGDYASAVFHSWKPAPVVRTSDAANVFFVLRHLPRRRNIRPRLFLRGRFGECSAEQSSMPRLIPKRHDDRIIIHFVSVARRKQNQGANVGARQDYDCFYASVFEAEDPALKHLPLAVQQKQIIVTCNYEARKYVRVFLVSSYSNARKGLHKLQLIASAKQVCPDVVIKLGEDLTRFRNASKALYNFLRQYSWCDKVEKLGFDEVRETPPFFSRAF